MSLGAEDLNWVKSSELAVAQQALGGEKNTSCVIWRDSETVINQLPGYG
jgi:hypothetical protein